VIYSHSLSSNHDAPAAKNIDELIFRVEQAFTELDPRSIDCNFLTLQSCLDEIIKDHGGNNYKIPHLGKAKLRAEGGGNCKLPDCLPVSDVAKDVLEQIGILYSLAEPM
jgi:hypothetical protein